MASPPVHAPSQGRRAHVDPACFASPARRLEINYFDQRAAGSIRVEIQDSAGKPLTGFALSSCPEIIGDEIERIVAWKDEAPTSSKLIGQAIRLRFVMKDADLFSLLSLIEQPPPRDAAQGAFSSVSSGSIQATAAAGRNRKPA